MSKLKTLFHFLWSDFPRYRITFFINCYNLICLLWCYIFEYTLEPNTEIIGSVVILYWTLCFNFFIYAFFFILLYEEKTNRSFFSKSNYLFKNKYTTGIFIFLFVLVQFAIYNYLLSNIFFLSFFYLSVILFLLPYIEIRNKFINILATIGFIIFLIFAGVIALPLSVFYIFFFIDYRKEYLIKKNNPVFKNKLYKVISLFSLLFIFYYYFIMPYFPIWEYMLP